MSETAHFDALLRPSTGRQAIAKSHCPCLHQPAAYARWPGVGSHDPVPCKQSGGRCCNDGTEPLGMMRHQAGIPRVQVWRRDDADGLKRFAAAVENQDCRLLGQIQDAGRGRHFPGRNPEAIGASALPDDLSWTVPRALTAAEIRMLTEQIAEFGVAPERLRFSGVEISAGHGHLFHQFLSPWSNRRDDGYRGDGGAARVSLPKWWQHCAPPAARTSLSD